MKIVIFICAHNVRIIFFRYLLQNDLKNETKIDKN